MSPNIIQSFTLKNGKVGQIRPIQEDDAADMLAYLRKVNLETDFLLRYPEELLDSVEDERKFIQKIVKSHHAQMLVCIVEGQIVANAHLSRFTLHKVEHRAEIAIAVVQEYWNQGIGHKLLEELETFARERGIEQLELEYIESNERARTLYEKCGFRGIAVRPNAYKQRDGKRLGAVLMQKDLRKKI